MNDDLGLFGDDEPAPRRDLRRSRSRRRMTWFGTGAVIAVIGLLAWYGVGQVLGIGGFSDYSGTGRSDVLVQVKDGQSQRAIASELADQDVVASARAFTAAGEDNDRVLSVQPGYYVLKTKMSGTAAVNRITSPDARVGTVEVKPGSRVDDVGREGGSVTEGLLSQLSEASCANLNGTSTCIPADQLADVVAKTDLKQLGVPGWAATAAAKTEPKHRLEGLILPGVYQVKPGEGARALLRRVLADSAARMSAAGLPAVANGTGRTPYDILKIASLVQSEGIPKDFGKVSRVIQNRLGERQELQLDSTVNYVLDRPEIRTTAADRDRAGPYNTYSTTGIPPSPISSPSDEAITAAAKPEPGSWKYFVKCEKDGSSCFSTTDDQHRRNVRSAQERGVY